MRMIAVDGARIKTGYCIFDVDATLRGQIYKTGSYDSGASNSAGLQLLSASLWFDGLLKEFNPDLVLIEGYAYSKKGDITKQAEMIGCFKMIGRNNGYELVEVSINFWRNKIGIAKYKGLKKQTRTEVENYLQVVAELTMMKFETTDEADAYMIGAAALIIFKDGAKTKAEEFIITKARATIKARKALESQKALKQGQE